GWWSVTVEVADAAAEITYQSRFAQAGTTKYQKAFENFSADPTFTTTTGQIWIDARSDGSFTWSGNDFYLAQNKITQTQPTDEPTNHPTLFTATTNSSSAITVAWNHNDGAVPATNYLILAKKGAGTFATVADGTFVDDDANWGDNNAAINVAHNELASQTYQWTGLTPSTTYDFLIYPYNGSGIAVNYKTDGTIPPAQATTSAAPIIVINEVDADNLGVDAAEFIELYDGGVGNTDLSGLVVVFYNGNGDISYAAYDLDGKSTNANGYFVLGNAGVPGVGLVFANDLLQNGQDGVALYLGDATSFPNGTAVTASNLLDAFVYDTDDADDAGLLVLLNSGQPQVNENGRGNGSAHSSQRLPNGTGGQRNTSTYDQTFPTPNALNDYPTFTWTGTTDTDWGTASNWSSGIVPDITVNVIIPNVAILPNAPVINNAVNINFLKLAVGGALEVGATLTIEGDMEMEGNSVCKIKPAGKGKVGGDLTIWIDSFFDIFPLGEFEVTGTLTNDAGATGLLIESDATGTGSLINSSENVLATVERYLAKYNDIEDQMFHFISSPIEAQEIQPEFVDFLPDPVQDFYAFDEPTNMWINSKLENGDWNGDFDDNFLIGKGYLVAYPTDVTKNFIGVLNYSGIEIACTNTVGQGEGWNLLGNHFPSAIDWSLVTLGDGMDDALYYYDNAAQNYRYYIQLPGELGALGSGQQYIPAMQGFMVHAKTTGVQTVTISDAARTHLGQNVFYKSTTSVPGSLSLKVSSSGFEDEMFVHFTNGATTQFDGKFDAFKLSGYNAQVPQLYTMSSDNRKLAINGLPELSESLEIPVYFYAGIAGQQSITADLSNLETTVYLIDLKTGTNHNLTENPVYSFTAEEGDNPNRFLLKFEMVGIGENPAIEQTSIYSHGQSIYISSTQRAEALISVFNITGQQVYSQQLVLDGLKQITLNVPTGWYVVKAISSGSAVSRKVFIR
ncbi:MAG: T9SS type A sorting domain-containing protein, partial [Bacteroidales bacterium]|nr:T9SS type A sorting domain-containing protein [Bacteroidales bacterium]